MQNKKIIIKGARVNNLQNIHLEIPHQKFVVITGLSGSGKSSLAFDTIYAEGYRRYVESLSSYARQFLEQMNKPDVDQLEGISPTIAIDQKSNSHNPRSTVGTATEIYDLLRLLFAKIGIPHCPSCGQSLARQTIEEIANRILELDEHTEIQLLAPMLQNQKGDQKIILNEVRKTGYPGVRIDNAIYTPAEVAVLTLDKNQKHTVDIIVAKIYVRHNKNLNASLFNLLKTTFELGNGAIKMLVADINKEIVFNLAYQCPSCQITVGEFEPRHFSFNSPDGACKSCSGLGTKLEVDPELVITNEKLTVSQGAIKPWARITGNMNNGQMKILKEAARKYDIPLDTPIQDLSQRHRNLILYGTGNTLYCINEKATPFTGVIPQLEQKYRETDSDYVRQEIETYMRVLTCPACHGKRLSRESLCVTIHDESIADFVSLALSPFQEKMLALSEKLEGVKRKVAETIVKEIQKKLQHVLDIGLAYLTLDRATNSLSGGEMQRLRLATQIGASLTGVIYVLDEPSIGLHQKDIHKLIHTLKAIKDMGNTVIVVEHDAEIMEAADLIIDIGPGAGAYGGKIVAQGTPAEIKKHPASLTGKYLGKRERIAVKSNYRKGNEKYLTVVNAEQFNLKKLTVKIPLGKFICITGVSGSGKSTLITDTLGKALTQKFYRTKDAPGKHKEIWGIEHVDKVISIDQSPIGKTPRSNPATYTGVFTLIRDLFTQTQEAKMRGYGAGKFSFNLRGGRCEACAGEGYVRLEMKFLPDIFVACDQCHGRRYTKEALEIHYHTKNIADILDMSILEAQEFFKDMPLIFEKLNILNEVGLSYMKLGQSATTLSGGEAQRVKLATELSRRATGKTLYILDEPTTGLHFEDTRRLLLVLDRLVDKGNTVLVIEHNMDVIKCADWVIDMGPEGGDQGGYIVAEGTPKDIASVKESYTGQYLKKVLPV